MVRIEEKDNYGNFRHRPGLKRPHPVGYGVVEFRGGKYRPLEYGAIVTKAGEPFPRRLETIANALDSVLAKQLRIDAVSIEKLYFQNNQKTAIQVAEARGVILLCCQRAGLEIFEYTPLQVKSGSDRLRRRKKTAGDGDDPSVIVPAGSSQAGRHSRCVWR